MFEAPRLKASQQYLPSGFKGACRLSASAVNPSTRTSQPGNREQRKENSFQVTPYGCELPAKYQEEPSEPPDLLPRHTHPSGDQDYCHLLIFHRGSGHPGLQPGLFSMSSGNQLTFRKLPTPPHACPPPERWSYLPLSTRSPLLQAPLSRSSLLLLGLAPL